MDVIKLVLGTPLGYIMSLCYAIIQDYGLAIIVFTFLTKILLFPLNMWVQKNSIKMIKLQPKLNEIAAKYVGNRDKILEEQMKHYKQENYRPIANIIPMLIQILLILGLINVMYNPLEYLLHVNSQVIDAFTSLATNILNLPQASAGAQISVIDLVCNPDYVGQFLSVQVPGQDMAGIVGTIQQFNRPFLGLDLSAVPALGRFDLLGLVPYISGFSAFLMCFFQNKINVLQKEQSWLGKWGMAIFMTLFSAYFTFMVPAGVGLYWIFGNLFSILVMYVNNWVYKPEKYIDYSALEKSKQLLLEAKKIEQTLKPTKEQKQKAKEDYKRFFADDNVKQLVFYSEKSGFYKYFKGVIEYILAHSDIIIHYITGDFHDAVFDMNNDRIVPYYIDESKLIVLFMKLECKMMVMTTPDLQNFHLKRSLVDKRIEYVYMFHGLTSTHMCMKKGAYDYFDTLFCVGQHQIDEIKECEQMYGLKEKNLVPVGYGVFDEMLASFHKMDSTPNERPQILIAPSHQEDNLMDLCIENMLNYLVCDKFKVILRPHPQYLKRNPGKMEKFIAAHGDIISDNFIVETDFSSNESVFSSDVLVTDWSGIANEFSYTTKRPCLFINTPMKVLNPDYEKYSMAPLDISLRDKIGISIDPNQINTITDKIQTLLASKEQYAQVIASIVDTYVFNVGHSSSVGGEYIINKIKAK